MMKRSLLTLLLGLLVTNSQAQEPAKVLIAYYSATGHTRAMAEAVAEGARSVENVEVHIGAVIDLSNESVVTADAIILGSPVYNANIAPPVQEFINGWPFEKAPMRDKIGAAFVTAGGISAGEETAQLAILRSMLMFGMIVVGGPEWTQAFGASAITEEPPFDQQTEGVAASFREKGRALGKRVAELAVKLSRADR